MWAEVAAVSRVITYNTNYGLADSVLAGIVKEALDTVVTIAEGVLAKVVIDTIFL